MKLRKIYILFFLLLSAIYLPNVNAEKPRLALVIHPDEVKEKQLVELFASRLNHGSAELLFAHIMRNGIRLSSTIAILLNVIERAEMLLPETIELAMGSLVQAKAVSSHELERVLKAAEKRILTGEQRYALLRTFYDLYVKESRINYSKVWRDRLVALAGNLDITDTHSHMGITKVLIHLKMAKAEDMNRFLYALEGAGDDFWRHSKNIEQVFEILENGKFIFPERDRLQIFFQAIWQKIRPRDYKRFEQIKLNAGVVTTDSIRVLLEEFRKDRIGEDMVYQMANVLRTYSNDRSLMDVLEKEILYLNKFPDHEKKYSAMKTKLVQVFFEMSGKYTPGACVIPYSYLRARKMLIN